MDVEGLELQALGPGDLGRLIAAYEVACGLADELRARLAERGIGADAAKVTASLSAAGSPVVRLALPEAAAERLCALLAAPEGPARHSVPTHPPSAAA
jgi:hypothetical protein